MLFESCKVETPSSSQTTAELGLQVVRSTLTSKFGINENSFVQDDGSGLSRHNLVSPDALVPLISYIYSQDDGHIFYLFIYLSFYVYLSLFVSRK